MAGRLENQILISLDLDLDFGLGLRVCQSEFCSLPALSCSFEFMWGWWGGGYSQQLLSLNPTTVMVILLLGVGVVVGL